MIIKEFSDIMSGFCPTEAGQSLAGTYRWSRFHPDDITNEQWAKYLGATANVLTHGKLMYHIARQFLRLEANRFSDEGQLIFLFGILCHDWGEAKINGQGIGDVANPYKTEATQSIESEIANRSIMMTDLPPTIQWLLATGYRLVIEKNPRLVYGHEAVYQALHNAYIAIETTEYLTTAIKAYQSCKKLEAKQQPVPDGLVALTGRVLIESFPKVLEFAAQFPNSIALYLHTIAPLIDEMFIYVRKWLDGSNWEREPFTLQHREQVVGSLVNWELYKSKYKIQDRVAN